MNESYYINSELLETHSIASPPEPKWEMKLAHNSDLSFQLLKAPNAFHRFMQRIAFGIIWKRINKGRSKYD